MRILIIDNTLDRESWGAEDLRRLARQPSTTAGASVIVRRAPHSDLPPSPRGFDRIILSGSRISALDEAPWISALHQFVRSALNESVPLLGVCFGHQTLATVLASGERPVNACQRSQTPEFGWTEIERTERAPLLEGLSDTFYSFSAHFEEVQAPPPGTRVLARSRACAIQAFQLAERPIYGIQFHPERDIAGARRSFQERKKEKSPKTLLHPERSAELYDPKVGETIFGNFLKG